MVSHKEGREYGGKLLQKENERIELVRSFAHVLAEREEKLREKSGEEREINGARESRCEMRCACMCFAFLAIRMRMEVSRFLSFLFEFCFLVLVLQILVREDVLGGNGFP